MSDKLQQKLDRLKLYTSAIHSPAFQTAIGAISAADKIRRSLLKKSLLAKHRVRKRTSLRSSRSRRLRMYSWRARGGRKPGAWQRLRQRLRWRFGLQLTKRLRRRPTKTSTNLFYDIESFRTKGKSAFRNAIRKNTAAARRKINRWWYKHYPRQKSHLWIWTKNTTNTTAYKSNYITLTQRPLIIDIDELTGTSDITLYKFGTTGLSYYCTNFYPYTPSINYTTNESDVTQNSYSLNRPRIQANDTNWMIVNGTNTTTVSQRILNQMYFKYVNLKMYIDINVATMNLACTPPILTIVHVLKCTRDNAAWTTAKIVQALYPTESTTTTLRDSTNGFRVGYAQDLSNMNLSLLWRKAYLIRPKAIETPKAAQFDIHKSTIYINKWFYSPNYIVPNNSNTTSDTSGTNGVHWSQVSEKGTQLIVLITQQVVTQTINPTAIGEPGVDPGAYIYCTYNTSFGSYLYTRQRPNGFQTNLQQPIPAMQLTSIKPTLEQEEITPNQFVPATADAEPSDLAAETGDTPISVDQLTS